MTENARIGRFERLSERLIEVLLSTRTQREAAMRLGISTRSLQRWIRHSAFQREFTEAKQQMLRQGLARLRADSASAAATLSEIAGDGDAPPGVRAGAAGKILDLSLRAAEFEDFETRLERLEESLKGD